MSEEKTKEPKSVLIIGIQGALAKITASEFMVLILEK